MTTPHRISQVAEGLKFVAVCSAKPRPFLQHSRSYFLKTGEAAWGRDIYHILDGDHDGVTPLSRNGGRTLCGVNCTEWIVIGPMTELTRDCCTRCKAHLEAGQ